VDTQGHLMAVKVTGADCSDPAGGRVLLSPHVTSFPRMKLLWGDSHYGGDFVLWVLVHMHWRVQTIKVLTIPKADRDALKKSQKEGKPGKIFHFRVLPRRWVVERTFAWITRFRRLCRDHEGLPSSSEAFITLAASSRMLRLLVPTQPRY
jgi:putative transposase